MKISNLPRNDEAMHEQVAETLRRGFSQDFPHAWPDFASALEEVRESLGEGRISRVGTDGSGRILGWVAGRRQYSGHTWELHPLVVHPDHQRRGLGSALVRDFEAQVRARNATTIWLGTDDETNLTSLGGVELYPDVLGHLASIRNLGGHPFEFYAKLGYVVVGALPDANGPGKPDIFMAKRLRTI